MFLSALGVLVGCSGGGAGYTLHLTPVAVPSQAPFEGVDRIDLVLTPAVGDALRVALGEPSSGSTPEVTGLPPLEETRITVEGYSGDTLVLHGRTEPITADSGEISVDVFVATAEASAWFEPVEDGLHLPLVAALGDGKFWIGGGVTNNRADSPEKPSDTVRTLSLAPPDGTFAFVESGTLPSYVDADGDTETARMGAGFTPLTVEGPDKGKILLTGGADKHPYSYDGQTTRSAALYDPATDTWEELGEGEALTTERALHIAIENLLGNVVVWGGLGKTASRSVILNGSLELYDAAQRTFTDLGPADLGYTGAMATDLGADGTLLCGGALLEDGWTTVDTCVRVSLDGSAVDAFPSLPSGLAGAAMVTLDDGRVLLTGGATAASAVDPVDSVNARTSAWLYNPETEQWGSLSASMAVARAGHRMEVLADGRVLIIGGAEQYNLFFAPPSPVSCLELYDPAAGTFESINGCDAGDESGGLPMRAYEPQVAYDPDYGVLVVGGLSAAGAAIGGVSLFVPAF